MTNGWPNGPTADQPEQPATDNPSAQPADAAAANPWDAPVAAASAASRKKKNRMWVIGIAAIAAIAVAATVFFVVTGDPGVKSGDNEITNASDFASEQTEAWNASLPAKGVTLGEDAQCYYVADEATEEVTGQLACGPVRRPEKSEAEVWDLLDYKLDSGASGQVTASLDSPTAAEAEKSQKLPTGTILISGDGQIAEASGTGLKEPELPPAPPNSLWTSDMVTVDDADKGAALALVGETTIAGLGTQFTVDSIVEVSEVTIGDTIAKAPSGQKFYLISLSSSDAPNQWSGSNELSFTLGREQRSAALSGESLTYLVTAPEAGPLQMVLTTAGKKQTLDLLTGQRTGDTYTELLYTDGATKTSSPGTTTNLPRVTQPNGVYFDPVATVTSVETQVFEGGSWAPDGQVFVKVDIEVEIVNNTSPTSFYYGLTCSQTTANEGSVSCTQSVFSSGIVKGTVAAGKEFTLNFAGTLEIGPTPTDGTPYDFAATTIVVPLPA